MRSLPIWHMYWNNRPGSELIFPDRLVKIPVDRLVLIPPRTVFSTRMESDFDHFYIDFVINLPPFSRIKQGEIILPLGIFLPFLEKDYADRTLQSLHIHALLFEVLLHIPETCFVEPQACIDSRILKALELIEKDEAYQLKNASLARQINMSVSNFQHLFRRSIGISPKKYILNLRLDKGRSLLLNSSLTIESIAAKSGFSDRYHFSKEFRNVFKISPASFRRKNFSGVS